MELSIIIPSLNEGEFLHRTIESIYANTQTEFEVIVVDDASSGGSTEYADWGKYSGHIFHRNSARLGLIRSRILGTTLACGRYLMYMDAHCNPSPGWEIALLEALDKCQDRAITVPISPMLDATSWKNHPHQVGKTMTFDQNLDMVWCGTEGLDFDDACWQSPVFAGSSFLVSRMFYEELGGLDNGLPLWGGENIDLSLRCWMFGGKILVIKSSVVGHMFKSGFNYTLSHKDIIANKLRVAYINFSNERFQRVSQRLGAINTSAEEAVSSWSSAQRRRAYLMENRRFDDDWYMEKFGMAV
jgi:glycosyltransferase involved in cell wall biosynthesis